MVTSQDSIDRVVWVGTGRRPRRGFLRFLSAGTAHESERDWRERLAQEMNEACDRMAQEGLRLANIVPVESSTGFQGGWTEGAWLHFTKTD